MDFLPNEKEDPISSYMFCIESIFNLIISKLEKQNQYQQ